MQAKSNNPTDNKSSSVAHSARTVRWIMLIGGVCLAAISVFSMLHAYLEFGLSEIIERAMNFYRGWFYPIAQLFEPAVIYLSNLINISVPLLWRELVVIYFLVLGSMLRVLATRPMPIRILFILYYGILWPLGLPTVFIIGLFVTRSFREAAAGTISRYAELLIQIAVVLVCVAAIFAFNAYGP